MKFGIIVSCNAWSNLPSSIVVLFTTRADGGQAIQSPFVGL